MRVFGLFLAVSGFGFWLGLIISMTVVPETNTTGTGLLALAAAVVWAGGLLLAVRADSTEEHR